MPIRKRLKPGSTVAAPRAKPSGASLFPHVSAPRAKPIRTNVYTKSVLREDPMKFSDFGFGPTGLTGES